MKSSEHPFQTAYFHKKYERHEQRFCNRNFYVKIYFSAIISEKPHSESYYSFTARSVNKIFPQDDLDLNSRNRRDYQHIKNNVI